MRVRTLPVWLAAAWLLAAPCTGLAQTSPAIPLQGAPDANPSRQPLAWSSLDPDQQRMLAPLQGQWNGLPPARQRRLAAHAAHWASLPPERQQRIRERLTRWAAMTPEQRHQLRENARAFRDLTPAERAKVDAAFRRFQALSPAERRALRERWHRMSPEQRQRWATGRPGNPISAHPPARSGH